jgi:hypothetical protein
MGVPTSDVGYTSATNGRGDHEVRKGHVVALAQKRGGGAEIIIIIIKFSYVVLLLINMFLSLL